jgi:hypothetical protein
VRGECARYGQVHCSCHTAASQHQIGFKHKLPKRAAITHAMFAADCLGLIGVVAWYNSLWRQMLTLGSPLPRWVRPQSRGSCWLALPAGALPQQTRQALACHWRPVRRQYTQYMIELRVVCSHLAPAQVKEAMRVMMRTIRAPSRLLPSHPDPSVKEGPLGPPVHTHVYTYKAGCLGRQQWEVSTCLRCAVLQQMVG